MNNKMNKYKNFELPNLLSLITQYRTNLMGIGMLWIILCHVHKQVNLPIIIKYPFFGLGFGGVEFFMFCAGFGIYYYLSKNPNLLDFYFRRVKRFLPAIPFFIAYFIISKITSIPTIFSYFTYQSFWIQKSAFAFLSYIFLFYLISPIFYNIINTRLTTFNKQIYFLILLFILTISYWSDWRISGFARIISFVIGMYAAYWNKNKLFMSYKQYIGTLLISAISFVGLVITHTILYEYRIEYGLCYYFMAFFVPGLILSICFFYQKLNINKDIFYFIGERSLEIFLVDSMVVMYLRNISPITHVLASIGIGFLYYYLYKKFSHILKLCKAKILFLGGEK